MLLLLLGFFWLLIFFFFKQKTAYEMRISDWSSDVCSSDLNAGWVSVGIDHDTASFAVRTIGRWWQKMGRPRYRRARSLLITADAGGSNGARLRLWKWELQQLANRTGLAITTCHFPPGTSKWNTIEHRLFSYIRRNWRGQPLVSRSEEHTSELQSLMR